jgi:hypothetical protein
MCNPNTMMGTATGIRDALGRWDGHIVSWTQAPGLPRYVVRYEDMLSNPARTIRGLLDFMRVEPDAAKLAKAIKATTFEALKKQEEQLGFNERPDGVQAFFAKGQSGVWREELTAAHVARIREEFLPTLQQWYPEMLDETEEFAKAG